MQLRHILIVAVDGLRASALGAYGNTTFGTPALDAFAAESFLFDSCFTPAAELAANYQALWQSLHPLRGQEVVSSAAALPGLLSERGYRTTLVTDAMDVAALPTAARFDECVQLAGEARSRVDDVAQTAMARLFAEACDRIAAPSPESQLVWVHSRGMYGAWDAPLWMQESLRDEGDPAVVDSVAPPDFDVAEADDPDTAFRYGVGYAAQVMVMDGCWAALRDALESSGARDNWLVVLAGVRGFPLGEHGRVGGVDSRLYAEQLHVPWLIRFPEELDRLARCGNLVSPLDLAPTLLEWIERDVAASSATKCDGESAMRLIQSARSSWRDSLLSASGATGERAIRTENWALRFLEGTEGGELFVRPDDRWEANDVAALCRDVVEELRSAAEAIAGRLRTDGMG